MSASADLKPGSCAAEKGGRGFTLLEALVALAVTAAGLAAIGQLGFGALSAARRAGNRLDLVLDARAALAALPSRSGSHNGVTSGQFSRDRWRVTSRPFAGVASGGPNNSGWTPELQEINVSNGAGASITLYTVRLRRGGP